MGAWLGGVSASEARKSGFVKKVCLSSIDNSQIRSSSVRSILLSTARRLRCILYSGDGRSELALDAEGQTPDPQFTSW